MARQATKPQRGSARESAPSARGELARPSVTPARRTGGEHRLTDAEDAARFNIEHEWSKISAVMLGGFLLVAATSLAVPPVLSIALAVTAAAIPLTAKHFTAFERERAEHEWQRDIAMAFCVFLPMLLFGFAMAYWSHTEPRVDWPDSVGTLLVVGTIASIVMSGRLKSVFAIKLGIWAGMVVFSRDLLPYVLVAVFVALGAVAIRRKAQRDAEDLDRRRELLRVQRRAEKLLSEYEQSGLGWFWETDRRGLVTYVSPTIGKVLGRDVADIVGQPFTNLFILDGGGQESERTLNFQLSARAPFTDLAVRAAVPGNEERWWSVTGRPIHDSLNNFTGFRGSGSDLTEKKRAQENETRLAHYDSLTSLANRFQMSQTLEKVLNNPREDHRACSVFLLDLDRFKQVNDTMGHPAGDALLTQVAQRLERTVDSAGRVGRLGGDEFQVILPGRSRRSELAALADRIIENLSHPYSIEGHAVNIGVSIGIALAPEDGVTSEALIRNADLALYAAKDGGRGRHNFYAAALHADAEERRQLENDLREALITGGLELHYQPVVHTATERITGFEALLRWNHPAHGYLAPGKFIPVAEEAGLIAPIGEWALRTACMDLAQWPENVRVAVNVSPLQFANPALPAIVTNALAAAQVDPGRLELEITESVFLNDDAGTDAMFAALKRVGVRLALDDFGTGYSSLGYLKKAPFDKIKIDQSFVRGATMKGSRNGAIIAAIVSLAEALGMETTAEGVETLDELELVRMHGCSHIQGFIYEKPIDATAAAARLKSGLIAIAHGPKSAREPRQMMLRKITLEHNGEKYQGTIRNITTDGALIEGLWNVPPGTVFIVELSPGYFNAATSRWSQQDRMGVEFAAPLGLDANGRVSLYPAPAERCQGESILLRHSG